MNSTAEDLENLFEIRSTVEWIHLNKYRSVGLQLEPSMRKNSGIISSLFHSLAKNCKFYTIIPIKSSKYAPCCVDVITCLKMNIDAIVHFGYACLSPLAKEFPVKYVLGNLEENTEDVYVEKIINKFYESEEKCMTILYDCRLRQFSKCLANRISKINNVCVHFSAPITEIENYKNEHYIKSGSRLIFSKTECSQKKCEGLTGFILYLSLDYDNRVKSNILPYYHSNPKIFVLSLKTKEIYDTSSDLYRILLRRSKFARMIPQYPDIKILSLNDSKDKVTDAYLYLKEMAEAAGKQVTMYQNRRLANMNLDLSEGIVVLLSCPDSLLGYCDPNLKNEESLQFHLVTPFELMFALAPTGTFGADTLFGCRYVMDVAELLEPKLRLSETVMHPADGEDYTDFSVDSGASFVVATTDMAGSGVLMKYNTERALASIGREKRTYYGLDMQLGQTPVAMLQTGLSGIASSYISEPK